MEQNLNSLDGGGELLRNIDNWSEKGGERNYSLDELLQKWYLARAGHSAKIVREKIPDYDDIIRQHMKQLCSYHNLNPDKMSIDETYLLEMAYRCMADTQVPTFMMQNSYTWLLSFEYNVQNKRTTHKNKDNAEFMLRVIDALCPQVLEVPIFTHAQHKVLDRKKMILVPKKLFVDKVSQVSIISLIRLFLPKRITRLIWHPVKKRIIEKSLPKSAPLLHVAQKEELTHSLYRVDISQSNSSEDVAIYSILIRALKKLGY